MNDQSRFIDPNTPPAVTGVRLQVTSQSAEDRTLTSLMQHLALTNRRLMQLEASTALLMALVCPKEDS